MDYLGKNGHFYRRQWLMPVKGMEEPTPFGHTSSTLRNCLSDRLNSFLDSTTVA